MIREIIQYPNPSIRLISANVRFFDDELRQWITDMIDTMKAGNLDALSAILVGIQYNVIVIKEGDEYIPYINARLIKHANKATFTERSLYYPGISVEVERYTRVTAIYEDAEGNPHHRDLEGEEARRFQQYLDYAFGSTFVDRVDKEMKRRLDSHLEFGLVADARGGSCPTVFYRDYFKSGAKILMLLILLSCAAVFFVSADAVRMLYSIDKLALAAVPLLIIGYILYAFYESRKYKQCTSCQTGNIIGTTAILLVQLLIVGACVLFRVKL